MRTTDTAAWSNVLIAFFNVWFGCRRGDAATVARTRDARPSSSSAVRDCAASSLVDWSRAQALSVRRSCRVSSRSLLPAAERLLSTPFSARYRVASGWRSGFHVRRTSWASSWSPGRTVITRITVPVTTTTTSASTVQRIQRPMTSGPTLPRGPRAERDRQGGRPGPVKGRVRGPTVDSRPDAHGAEGGLGDRFLWGCGAEPPPARRAPRAGSRRRDAGGGLDRARADERLRRR